jgi:hypothetical protein
MKKKFLVIVGMLAFINSYAANNDNDYQNCEDYQSAFQGHSAPEDQMKKGYNHPARIDVKNSWDFYVSGSYIYWQPRQDGLELAREIVEVQEGFLVLHVDNTFVHMDFDYHSGFKVGMGGSFERDDWSLDFEYTRLYTTDHRSKTLSDDPEDLALHYFVAFWAEEPRLSTAFYAKARWKLHFNILDGTLGRNYYVGEKLSFKPYVGLRAGWIDQKYRADYTFTDFIYETPAYSNSKSDSWVLGPRVGLDTNWHLGEGFRLFGNTAAALFYQRFKTDVELVILDQEEPIENTLRTMKEKEGYFNPNFEIALGLGWGSYFCDDSWHIDLAAAYDFHIFWDQNMMRKILDYYNTGINSDPTPGDLILHGLTVSLKLDF